MSEQKTEGLVEGQENTEGTGGEPQEVQYTPVQLKAIEQGWIPKEEFDGDPEEFIDAAEFVRRGELFGKINAQNKQVKELREALQALKQHNSKIREVEYERALKALKNAKRKAEVEGEHQQAWEIEDRMEQIEAERKAHVESQKEEKPTGTNEDFDAWVEANPWYSTDETMRDAADAYGRRLHAKGVSNEEIFKKVTEHIKKEFAHKFRAPGAKRPQAVEGSSRATGKTNDDVVLSERENEMMRKIVKTGIMTEKEYKAQLKAAR